MTTNDSTLSPTKQALLAVKTLQEKLNTLERAQHEPLAIIGMSCRFPGNVHTPELYWQLLMGEGDAVAPLPPNRWDLDAYYDAEVDNPKPGKTYVQAGCFLPEIDRFDAAFFGIAPREAMMMDPQQRLVLEVAWEALERAGLAPTGLADTQTGVFLGVDNYDYAFVNSPPFTTCDAYTGTGAYMSVAAGRLSYSLGLRGPALTVDTACSSSLTAVHIACQNLRLGECSLALAGGVFLMTTPYHAILNANAQALAPDGRCKTFDDAANGFGQGEGCGIIVLKRLSDALRDGDPVLALIRGSAINHDGRSSGLTVPNALAQQQVIRQAFANGQVDAAQVGYIEAHGTGTALGDPIEVDAIAAVFGNRSQPVWIGSAKPKIGHLDAAAGIAGLIKVVLCLQHQTIPAHTPLTQPSQRIPWAELPVALPRTAQPFPQLEGKRIAGVSSFGMSGTNAHVVLEEAPNSTPLSSSSPTRTWHLLTLNAKSQGALAALSQRYIDYLSANPALSPADLCFTANSGRAHFPYRLGVVGSSLEELRSKLVAAQNDYTTTGILGGKAKARAKIAFLFTGQGAQYVNMGRELYETQPIFRRTLDRCAEILQPLLGESILTLLYPQEQTAQGSEQSKIENLKSKIDQTAYTQPALFAIEYALTELWKAWGITPDFVMGHSVGELVAACVAGVFSLEDGCKLIAARGRLMGALPQDGSMVAVMASEARVQTAVKPYSSQVALAAVNGPDNVVISGERSAVAAIGAQLQADGIKTTALSVSHAFHSPLMEPMVQEFRQVARTIRYTAPSVPLVSNVTGQLATTEVTDPAYWVRHVRYPVRFADGIATLQQQGIELFLEIGPKPILVGMAQSMLDFGFSTADTGVPTEKQTKIYLPSLRPGRSDWQQLLESLATFYMYGVRVDWVEVDGRDEKEQHKVILPTYPFQRERYWVEEVRSTPVAPTTPIVDWLNRGDVHALANLLKSDSDSPQEMTRLTDALTRLVEQHQAQLVTQQPVHREMDWLYQVAWQPHHLPVLPSSVHQPHHWIILADQGGVGQALAEQLQVQKQSVQLVYPGQEGQQRTMHHVVNPAEPADFRRLFRGPALQTPCKVVHLWSLDATPADAYDNSEGAQADLDQDLLLSCGSTLHLIQAITKQPTQVWFVTRGAMAFSDQPPVVNQSALWGLGRVIALERPELWGGLIDLDLQFAEPAAEAALLLSTLLSTQFEDQLAVRSGQVYAARLTPALPSPARQSFPPLRADGTYLITGGLGGLGFQVAQWMVEHGARHLLLSGRSGADGRADAIRQLEEAGTTVCVVKADIGCWEDAVNLMRVAQETLPPLRGIVHAAGVLDDGLLPQQTWSRFVRVMAPKVKGAWYLHCLTAKLPLDFFVLFSSDTALLGATGQGNYAAANAFMDALAHYRCALGLPALSINWSAWAEVGMAARLSAQQHHQWAEIGMQLIPVKQGLELFARLLNRTGQLSILPYDWTRFGPTISGQRPLLANLVKRNIAEPEPTFLTRLMATPARDRHLCLVEHLQTLVAAVLGARHVPEPTQGFFEMGLDSLMTVELRNRLRASLAIMLPPTLAFEYPTIERLASYLLQEICEENLSSPVVPPQDQLPESQIAHLTTIQALSDAELTTLIDAELADLLKGSIA